MREDLKTTDFLFSKIKRLYPTFVRPDEIDIDCWLEVLEGYSQTEILDALKAYRKNCEYNSAPIPGTFKKYLHHKSESETESNSTVAEQLAKCGDYAWERMNADIEAGCCRNNLYVYRDAERIVITDWLSREIPADVWRRMCYQSRVKAATDKGLFNNFDEALKQAAKARFGRGRENEYMSANDFENQKNNGISSPLDDAFTSRGDVTKTLAAHWGI